MGLNTDGDTYYVDLERIKKVDGYVFYWNLHNYLKPIKYEYRSYIFYNQGDCRSFRFKILNSSFYKEQMGGGTPYSTSNKPDSEWTYPPTISVNDSILKQVCSR